jgi:hypothetical protein
LIAIASFLLLIAVSLVITRVATVVLVASGMTPQHARFQARSAFTGTGFTTREAESVVNHPLRRKVVMLLMLLGNAGLVAAAASLIIGFRASGTGTEWVRLLELVIGLLALVFLSRSAWIDRRMTAWIGALLRRFTDIPARDAASLLQLSGTHAVDELAVRGGDWVAGRSLGELELRAEGVVVLGIVRTDGSYLGAPNGETVVHPGATLVVYGHQGQLAELDRRPSGEQGDRLHAEAAQRRRFTARAGVRPELGTRRPG